MSVGFKRLCRIVYAVQEKTSAVSCIISQFWAVRKIAAVEMPEAKELLMDKQMRPQEEWIADSLIFTLYMSCWKYINSKTELQNSTIPLRSKLTALAAAVVAAVHK